MQTSLAGHRRFLLPLFVGPGLFLFIAFFFAPLLLMGIISFLTYSPTKLWVASLTLANYQRLIDPYYVSVTWSTVKIGLATTLGCVFLGYPLAYFLARTQSRQRDLYLFLLIAPLMASTVVRVFGWLIILGRHGMVNRLLLALGFSDRVQLLYNPFAVVLGLTELLMPFMVLPLMAAIESIHPSVEEAARNLGASGPRLFRRVILPLSLPGLISGSLLVYSIAISALVAPALLGGPRVHMLGNVVYSQVLTGLNWPFASSVAIVLLLFTGAVMWSYIRLTHASERWRKRG